jgi:integrase/recombinase XerD
MSALRTAFDEYLAVRRALGYKLHLEGRLLRRFVDFAERSGAEYITTELALNWATQPAHAQPSQWANRLAMARRFARYCRPNDPRTVVPPPDLLPHKYRRVAPYIYSDEEIIVVGYENVGANRPIRCFQPHGVWPWVMTAWNTC